MKSIMIPSRRSRSADKKSPEMMTRVIDHLSQGWSYTATAEHVGVSVASMMNWKKIDPVFAARCADAVEEGADRLEDAARKRAVDGVDRPVYQGGELVGHVREYSDALLMFLLRGKRPMVFARERRELTGANGEPLLPVGSIGNTPVSSAEARERLRQVGVSGLLIDESGD